MIRHKTGLVRKNVFGAGRSWSLVPLKSIHYVPSDIDANQGVYPRTFWLRYNSTTRQPESKREYFPAWQDVDWRYTREYLQAVLSDKDLDPNRIVLEGNPAELKLMHSLLKKEPIELWQCGDGHSEYEVYNGYHRLLMFSNCAFDLQTVTALGWDHKRMVSRGGLYCMQDRNPPDDALVYAIVQS